jgi:hypothetical protein
MPPQLNDPTLREPPTYPAQPTILFQVLANVPLWGARSGLKMARWSPCDAVLLWFFEAVS